MSESIPSWPREYFSQPGGEPFLFYVVYGQFDQEFRISDQKYRCTGVPDGLEIMQYGPRKRPEVVSTFRDGYLWDELKHENAGLASAIEQQTHCTILRGNFADIDTLDDFRNTIGLITYLLDSGGLAVYDPQMFAWWSPAEWHDDVFAPGQPVPRTHVKILFSADEDGEWFHTRGMRKFGRPDLSIPAVPARYRDAVMDLCNRFIEFQAFGGVIAEGEEIRLKSLPSGMRCTHKGSLDDPDFNNVHVEIVWPKAIRT